MSNLEPVAFDIETTGFDSTAQLTVAGFAHEMGVAIALNTDGRPADGEHLVAQLEKHTDVITLDICDDESTLLTALAAFADRLDGDRHYLTAFNGETWNGGFDLPFCRTRFHRHGMDWPFGDLAYADMMDIVDRFDTDDENDLVGVYDTLIGKNTCDPFEDSKEAVDAFENGDWYPLLKHNLADIHRTRELAVLASEYVPKSDFSMKNLAPPQS